MSQFSVEAVESLDYDFTGFPHNVQPTAKNAAKKFCTGKGVVPEPTQSHLTAYSDSLKALYSVDTVEDLTDAVNAESGATPSKEKDAKAATEKLEKLAALTAALCQNSPSKAELMELPPRIRTAFLKWVYKELADPEVSRGDSKA